MVTTNGTLVIDLTRGKVIAHGVEALNVWHDLRQQAKEDGR